MLLETYKSALYVHGMSRFCMNQSRVPYQSIRLGTVYAGTPGLCILPPVPQTRTQNSWNHNSSPKAEANCGCYSSENGGINHGFAISVSTVLVSLARSSTISSIWLLAPSISSKIFCRSPINDCISARCFWMSLNNFAL